MEIKYLYNNKGTVGLMYLGQTRLVVTDKEFHTDIGTFLFCDEQEYLVEKNDYLFNDRNCYLWNTKIGNNKFAITNGEITKYAARCSHCGKTINEGFCIDVTPPEHYCSEKCINEMLISSNVSDDEFMEYYNNVTLTTIKRTPNVYIDDRPIDEIIKTELLKKYFLSELEQQKRDLEELNEQEAYEQEFNNLKSFIYQNRDIILMYLNQINKE